MRWIASSVSRKAPPPSSEEDRVTVISPHPSSQHLQSLQLPFSMRIVALNVFYIVLLFVYNGIATQNGIHYPTITKWHQPNINLLCLAIVLLQAPQFVESTDTTTKAR